MFLILCQVNNSLQGRGKLKCVRQILIHFRCLRRRNQYKKFETRFVGGREDRGLLDYLLFPSISFYASLLLLTQGYRRFGFLFEEIHMLPYSHRF